MRRAQENGSPFQHFPTTNSDFFRSTLDRTQRFHYSMDFLRLRLVREVGRAITAPDPLGSPQLRRHGAHVHHNVKDNTGRARLHSERTLGPEERGLGSDRKGYV
jgi:hypothetical protein